MKADTTEGLTPPDGFGPTNSRGAFTLHNGPTYRALAEDDFRSGFYVLDRHCNGMGFLHGGMMSAFADSSLAWAVWSQTRRFSVTLKLTLEYLDVVRTGAWVEAMPGKAHENDGIVHISTPLMTASGRRVAQADGIFRLMRRAPKPK